MDNASKQSAPPDVSRRTIIGIWAAWAAALLIFQAIVPMRLELACKALISSSCEKSSN